jgi:hypothetical protein
VHSSTLSLTSEWIGWVISATPRSLYHQEETWIVRQGPVWTAAENLVSTGIRSRDSPVCSKSLHRVPVLTSSCQRRYCTSLALTWIPPTVRERVLKNNPYNKFLKILFVNSLICSKNGFRKTMAHQKKIAVRPFRNYFANRHQQTTWAAATNRRIPPTRPLVRSANILQTHDSACQRGGRTRRQFDDRGGKVLCKTGLRL